MVTDYVKSEKTLGMFEDAVMTIFNKKRLCVSQFGVYIFTEGILGNFALLTGIKTIKIIYCVVL
jgi:hypothetical protein